jgi:thymidylate synthase
VKQYLDLCQRIVDDGTWIENERTGKRCLTVINADLEYDVGNNQFPLVTTRKSFWKSAVAELLGYIRGYDNAEDFRKLGTKTWDANSNLNEAWLNNPYPRVKTTWDVFTAFKDVHGRNLMVIILIN